MTPAQVEFTLPDRVVARRRPQAGALGLSSYSNKSDENAVRGLEIDQRKARVYRCRRSVRAAAEAFRGQGTPVMLTLTYRDPEAWRPGHISECLEIMAAHFKRRGVAFRRVWVAELQERGAVHYHVLVWLPRGGWIKKPDREGWWPHGSTNISTKKKVVRDATAYLVKYASKLSSKDKTFPKGLRLHGIGGLEKFQRADHSHHMLPAWIRTETTPEMLIRRRPGGGYFSLLTGEVWISPWVVELILFRMGVGSLAYVCPAH